MIIRFCLLAALAAPQAHAQTPRLVPSRDVTIDYDFVEPNGVAHPITVQITAGGVHVRVVSAELPTPLLINRATGQATVLVPFLNSFTNADIRAYDPLRTILPGAHFNRGATEKQAGWRCTHWTAQSPRGQGAACITADGVILTGEISGRRRGAGFLKATHVTYGHLPPDLFAIPPTYRFAGTIPLDAIGHVP
jgi:hypothetical protein